MVLHTGQSREWNHACSLYSEDNSKKSGPHILIFNTLWFTQANLSFVPQRNPHSWWMDGRFACHPTTAATLSNDSNMAQAKGVEFFLPYPTTLKIKVAGETKAFQSKNCWRIEVEELLDFFLHCQFLTHLWWNSGTLLLNLLFILWRSATLCNKFSNLVMHGLILSWTSLDVHFWEDCQIPWMFYTSE